MRARCILVMWSDGGYCTYDSSKLKKEDARPYGSVKKGGGYVSLLEFM